MLWSQLLCCVIGVDCTEGNYAHLHTQHPYDSAVEHEEAWVVCGQTQEGGDKHYVT